LGGSQKKVKNLGDPNPPGASRNKPRENVGKSIQKEGLPVEKGRRNT